MSVSKSGIEILLRLDNWLELDAPKFDLAGFRAN